MKRATLRPALKIDETSDEDFYATLRDATSALRRGRIPFVLIGGLASELLGRERATRDIDVFIKQRDADRALEALAGAGFATERTNRDWIFKGFQRGVQVDLIFVAKGLRLDDEMLDRAVPRSIAGAEFGLLAPEDLLVLKSISHDEQTPRHWFDGLGVLARQDLDWEYLERRARRHPSRVLSLLCYGRSLGLRVPSSVMRSLLELIVDDDAENGSEVPAQRAAHVVL